MRLQGFRLQLVADVAAARIISERLSTPKKHHYLPEFYLKGFSTAGWLWVYDRERNAYSKRRPETVAIRKGFYSIEDQDGGCGRTQQRGEAEGKSRPPSPTLRPSPRHL